jgi:alginate O-acetyltransferase complex protein AlgI
MLNIRQISYGRALFFWFAGFALSIGFTLIERNFYMIAPSALVEISTKLIAPLLISIAGYFLLSSVRLLNHKAVAYAMFFTITGTSFLGLTKTLTGDYAVSSNTLLYGLSFYTTSLGYLIFTRATSSATAIVVSNPLLIITGPIAIFVHSVLYRNFSKRWSYYFPFVVLGLFLFHGLALPVTKALILKGNTDLVSSIVFAVIFELFVYANFCGLSLIIFGLSGILGFKIPLNFRQPFSATNVIEYWRSWHTSLSSVMRQMFYLPLRPILGSLGAVFGVFLSSALWHGVQLNFMLWGIMHFIIFVLSLWLLRLRIKYLPGLLLLVAIVFGRLVFAESDTERLLHKLSFDYTGWQAFDALYGLPRTTKLALVLLVFFVGSERFFRKSRNFRNKNYKFYRLTIIQFIMMFVLLVTSSYDNSNYYAIYGQR